MNSKPRRAPPGGVSAVAHTLTANDAATLTLSVVEHPAGDDGLADGGDGQGQPGPGLAHRFFAGGADGRGGQCLWRPWSPG